jgi:tetratricopeptide (TPR) repeat protein
MTSGPGAMNRKERRAAAKQERSVRGKGLSAAQFAKIEKAIELVNADQLDEAEVLLDQVRRSDPNDPEAKHQIGMIYVRTGRADAGIALLRQAAESRPGESLYWSNLAAACLAVERSQESVDAARKALEIDRQNFMAWQNLALGLRDLDDHRGAIEAFDTAAGLGVMEPTALAMWGESLGGQGRFAEAERVIRRALDQTPDDPAIITLLGWLQVELKDDTAARATFRRSLDLKPEQFLAAFNYGVLSLRAGETETGLRWLRRATSIEPKSAAAWRVLAIELAKHHLEEEALPVAERCLRLAPKDDAIAKLIRRLKGEEEVAEVASFSIDFDAPAPIGPQAERKIEEAKAADEAPMLDLQIIKIGEDA